MTNDFLKKSKIKGTSRLASDSGGVFDAPQRPAEAPQRQDLLSFLFGQDRLRRGTDPPAQPLTRPHLRRGDRDPAAGGLGHRPHPHGRGPIERFAGEEDGARAAVDPVLGLATA